MVRNAIGAVIVVGLLGVGWVAGHAQAPSQAPTSAPSVSSDFELLVTQNNRGETEVTCVRGCRLTWAPTASTCSRPMSESEAGRIRRAAWPRTGALRTAES